VFVHPTAFKVQVVIAQLVVSELLKNNAQVPILYVTGVAAYEIDKGLGGAEPAAPREV
jgi:hypothetical protein